MEILSWRRSRHTPARCSAPPRSLARSIARDETNMSTFECTRKLPQHEYAIVLFKNISISLLKKIRKPFELFEMKSPFYSSFSKTPPSFQTIARHGPTFPTTSYRSVGIGVWNILHFIFFLKLKSFLKLAHGQSRASQLSISEDSAIRIVL